VTGLGEITAKLGFGRLLRIKSAQPRRRVHFRVRTCIARRVGDHDAFSLIGDEAREPARIGAPRRMAEHVIVERAPFLSARPIDQGKHNVAGPLALRLELPRRLTPPRLKRQVGKRAASSSGASTIRHSLFAKGRAVLSASFGLR
jgi:hypothetical protein